MGKHSFILCALPVGTAWNLFLPCPSTVEERGGGQDLLQFPDSVTTSVPVPGTATTQLPQPEEHFGVACFAEPFHFPAW